MIHSLGMEFLIDSLFAAAFPFQSAIVERNCGERMEAILGKTEAAVNLIGADQSAARTSTTQFYSLALF